MAVSDARRRATAKWDKAHMTTVCVKLTKDQAQQFAEACKALGVTRGQVLREAALKTIEKAGDQASS